MPLFISIDIEETSAGRALRERLAALRPQPLLKDIGEYMLNATDERFRTETGPDGEPWAELSPATFQWGFRKRYPGTTPYKRVGGERVPTAAFQRYIDRKKILQEQGRRGGLRGSINYRIDGNQLQVGTPKIYGRAQQKGLGERSGTQSRRRFGAIPARPFLGISETDRRIITEMVANYVKDEA